MNHASAGHGRPLVLRGNDGYDYAISASGRVLRLLPKVSPQTARRCKTVMAIAAAIVIVTRVGLMIAATAMGNSNMTTVQKGAIVDSACIAGLLAAVVLNIAFAVSVGRTVKRATTVVSIMFTLLCIAVAISLRPVMELTILILQHVSISIH